MFYYVDMGDDAVQKAFKKCGQLLSASQQKEAAIVVPQLSNLNGLISDVLGDQAVKLLQKDKKIRLDPEIIHLFTKRSPPRFFSGPLLVAFTPIDQLEKIILGNPNADIIFVPWAEAERDHFVKKYEPQLV